MTTRRRTYTRRAIIGTGTGIVAGAAVALSGAGYLAYREATEPISTVGTVDFDTRLTIPPLLDPEPDRDGRKRFDLVLQTDETEILPGRTTATWGVNGPFL